MEKKPVNNLVSSETALEGGKVNLSETAPSNAPEFMNVLGPLPETASRDEVIDTFMNRQVELSDSSEAIKARPGFNLDANQLIAKRSEQTQADHDFDVISDTWAEFGGNDIIDAQKAVDALNFNSTAEDRVVATNRLRDAKNAFYTNYTGRLGGGVENLDAPSVESSVSEPETPQELPHINVISEPINIVRPAVRKYNAEHPEPGERKEAVSIKEPVAAETAEVVPATPEKENQAETNETEARDALLRTHAARQSAKEATVVGILEIKSVVHGVQNAGSGLKGWYLRKKQGRAQRRVERYTKISENSFLSGRRKKYAGKLETAQKDLTERSKDVTYQENFVDRRQNRRDTNYEELWKRVENNREYWGAKSKIARERRDRRRKFLTEKLTLVDRDADALRKERKERVSMLEFRQAVMKELKNKKENQ